MYIGHDTIERRDLYTFYHSGTSFLLANLLLYYTKLCIDVAVLKKHTKGDISMNTYTKIKRGLLAPFTSCKVVFDHPQILIPMLLSVAFLYPRGIFNTLKLVKMFILIFIDLTLAHCVIGTLDNNAVYLKRALLSTLEQWKEAVCFFVLYLAFDYALFHLPLFHSYQYYTLIDGLLDHLLPIFLLLGLVTLASAKKPNHVDTYQGLQNIYNGRYEIAGFCISLVAILTTLAIFFPTEQGHELLFGTAYITLLVATALFHRVAILTFGLKAYRGNSRFYTFSTSKETMPGAIRYPEASMREKEH
jgi:hypothetical protein